MKKLYSLLIVVTLFSMFSAGCGDDVVGAASVAFTMGSRQGQNGIMLTFSPNVDVKCTTVAITRPATNDSLSLTFNDPNQVFTANQTHDLYEDANIQSGNQLVLYFNGSIVSSSAAFTNVRADVTIP